MSVYLGALLLFKTLQLSERSSVFLLCFFCSVTLWYRPHTLNSTSTSKSFQSTVTGELNAPYSKQFVHSKSSQYRKMKTEWKSNVYLARSRIQVSLDQESINYIFVLKILDVFKNNTYLISICYIYYLFISFTYSC